MSTQTDPRIDAHIAQAPEFARPVLEHLRALIHDVCPEVQETIKWRHAAFIYRRKILCVMAAFKAHCKLHFWNSEQLGFSDPEMNKDGKYGGVLGRLTCLADLPEDATLRRFVLAAMAYVETDEADRPPRPAAQTRKPELPVPTDFAALLRQAPAARKFFEGSAPSHRREYLEWIADAKRAETRARRMASAIESLAESKPRHWKYEAAQG